MGTARVGLTQKEHRERGVDQAHVLYRMACFLGAIIARLLSRSVGPLDTPFGAIMSTRGRREPGLMAPLGVAAQSSVRPAPMLPLRPP